MRKRSKGMKRYSGRFFFSLCITVFSVSFFYIDLSAGESCRKLSVAFMSESGAILKKDRVYKRLFEGVVSSISGDKSKISRAVPLTDLQKDGDSRCDNHRCAVDLCRKKGVDYLVSVKVLQRTSAKVSGHNKYLLRKDTGTLYSVSVRVTDIAAEKQEQLFSGRNITSGNAGSYDKRIRKSVSNYFDGIEICKDNKEQGADSFITPFGISVSGIIVRPYGSYEDTADIGYGANVRFSSYISGMKEFNLALDFSAASLSPAGENINSAYFLSPHLLAGYSFGLTESFRIVPSFGPGYVFHLIDGDRENSGEKSKEWYYNPSVSGGIEFIYNIIPGASVVMSPSCTYFFGQNGSGSYAVISAGYRYEF